MTASPGSSDLPRHIAVIMDGNGRWARRRGLPRVLGHREGIKAVRATVEACAELKIGYLTLFAFSVENWKRPETEISTLMELLEEYLQKELPTMMKNDIQFHTMGRIGELPPTVQERLARTREMTAENGGMDFTLALNYSGRTEIVDGVNRLLRDAAAPDLTEKSIRSMLYRPEVPDPDLLIRTSGEMRISNFLLWQMAYTEIHVMKVLWPNFRKKHLLRAIDDYRARERRFGGIHNET